MNQKPICECCKKEFYYPIPVKCFKCISEDSKKFIEAMEKSREEILIAKRREEISLILERQKSFWYKAKSVSYMVLLYVIPLVTVGAIFGIKYQWVAIAGGLHITAFRVAKDWLMERF